MNAKLIYLARRKPGTSREDWPKQWKSHAIYASQFPSIEASLEWLRYGNRVDQPTLDGAPVDLPMLSTAHDGVANVNSGKKGAPRAASAADPEIRAALDKDELRVFDSLVNEISFSCEEEPLLEGLPGGAAIYAFLPRKAGLSNAEFLARYEGSHADLARGTLPLLAGLKRYGHNRVVTAPPPRFPFEAISEIWFETPDDAVRALKDGGLATVLDDLAEFAAMDEAVIILTTPCHGWPKDEALLKREQERSAG
ncbi:MAG: EthD domain-containing protein [Novosphingobium sp.]|nr:EthD domain-containing protein [Novosphingobium sp.]